MLSRNFGNIACIVSVIYHIYILIMVYKEGYEGITIGLFYYYTRTVILQLRIIYFYQRLVSTNESKVFICGRKLICVTYYVILIRLTLSWSNLFFIRSYRNISLYCIRVLFKCLGLITIGVERT